MKKALIPSIITFILALVAVAAFFLPTVTATSEMAATIDSTTQMAESLNIDSNAIDDVKQLKNISLFDYATTVSDRSEASSAARGLFAAVGAISLLIAIVAILRRPILTLLFDLILAGLFALITYAIQESYKMGVEFNWGIGHTLYIPVIAVIAIGAIWMFIAKRIDKKAARRRAR